MKLFLQEHDLMKLKDVKISIESTLSILKETNQKVNKIFRSYIMVTWFHTN